MLILFIVFDYELRNNEIHQIITKLISGFHSIISHDYFLYPKSYFQSMAIKDEFYINKKIKDFAIKKIKN